MSFRLNSGDMDFWAEGHARRDYVSPEFRDETYADSVVAMYKYRPIMADGRMALDRDNCRSRQLVFALIESALIKKCPFRFAPPFPRRPV